MKLYKTTIVILSDIDPSDLGIGDLARDAEWGDCYCYSRELDNVHTDQFGEEVKNFFSVDEDEEK